MIAMTLKCITDDCNDAKVTTAMLPISVKYLGTLFERINIEELIITVISNFGGDVQ
jgi:hypothetical protein